jgi:GNAT superfamily N-acetyltransferase
MLFAEYDLARRLENFLCGWSVEFAQSQATLFPETGACAVQVGGGAALYAGISSPITKACGIGMNGPVSSADMDKLHDFYSARGVDAVVDVCPFADQSFIDQLNERGYRIGYFLNMWIRDLPGAPLPELAPGRVVVRQVTAGQSELWIRTVAKGFEETKNPDPADMIIPRSLWPNSTCFLALLDVEAVGGGAMSVVDDTAYFYSVSTVRSFRRLGIQAAVMQALIRHAAGAGCGLATVMTDAGGASHRNMERQGFRLAYTRMTMVEPR